MTRRLILHVGMPKCGSTYLQRVLLRNQGTLASHGINYPHIGEGHPGNGNMIDTLDRAGYDALFDGGIHTVILSHEDLFSTALRGKALAGLAREDGTEVQLLAFLRPFSDFMFGDYSQYMKQFFDSYLASRNPYKGQSFEQFALHRVHNLTPAIFLTNWLKCFERKADITVDSHRAIQPVLTRLLGPDVALKWDVPLEQTNPSLRTFDCDRIADAMRNRDITDDAIRAMFDDAFYLTDVPDMGRSDARRALIETAFAPQNQALLDDFGYDNTLPGLASTPRA